MSYLPWKEYELIETLWNVNLIFKSVDSSGSRELIETLWNVNLQTSGRLADGSWN